MAWESRQRGGKYYTRSRRVGGRVERTYIGTGPVAEHAAAIDELSRVLRSLVRLREEMSNEALMVPIREMSDQVDKIHETGIKSIGEYLDEQGYHNRRGEWRMRKDVSQMRSDLLRPDASPQEELLTGVVTTNWILWSDLVERYIQGSVSLTEKQDNFFNKQIDQAQKRFLQSNKTLAQVSRLLTKPSIQINVAKQQIVKNA